MKQFMGKLALSFALILVLGQAHALSKIDTLKPSEEQIDVTSQIVKKLSTRHYIKLPLDDEFSQELFDAYIEQLDPTRSFFLQKDIDSLSAYRDKLDDQLTNGDLSAGFKIYNIYHERVIRRLEKNLKNLDKDYAALDFSADDSLYIGEEKESWPTNQKAADEQWRKRLKHSALNLQLADKSDDEIVDLIRKRYKNRLNHTRQNNAEDVFEIYMDNFARQYDPHTNYFSPRTLENFRIRMSLSLEGIGAVLSQEDEFTKVVRLVKGGPAEKQGDLKRADKIVAVGQEKTGEMINVVGWRLDEVVELIRGEKDTWVRLELIAAKADDPRATKIIHIQRGKVELEEETAQKKVLEVFEDGTVHKVGVIEIPTFYIDFEALHRGDENYRSTTRDVAKLLGELEDEGVEGIVIDLRNNGGGSLQEVNQLLELFIEYGPTVQIRHANMRVNQMGKRQKGPFYDGPMVVLINRLSASASEIFAGAIQDYQRGVIVGSQTFGKGTVQALTPLSHGQLKITESKYYRISGNSTQHEGVKPDIAFPPIFDPEEVGESTLDGALGWDMIRPARYPSYADITNASEDLRMRHLKRTSVDPDFIYLKDQLALRKQAREQDSITLNSEERIKEREDNRARILAIENRRRSAKGLEPLEKLEEEDETDEDTETGDESEEDPEDDLFATEAAHILVDMNVLGVKVAIK